MSYSKDLDQSKSNLESEKDFARDPLGAKIGGSLRDIYQDVVNEAVPDEFLNILKLAEQKHSGKGN